MITKKQVLDTMAEVIKGHEDYRYTDHHDRCRYTEPDGSASCLVGQVVAVLDPEAFEEFKKYEHDTKLTFPISSLGTKYDGCFEVAPGFSLPKLSMSPAARRILRKAQSAQDLGNTWGYAYEEASLG